MNAQVSKVRAASQPFLEFLSSVPELAKYQKDFQKIVRSVLQDLASAAKQQTTSATQLPG